MPLALTPEESATQPPVQRIIKNKRFNLEEVLTPFQPDVLTYNSGDGFPILEIGDVNRMLDGVVAPIEGGRITTLDFRGYEGSLSEQGVVKTLCYYDIICSYILPSSSRQGICLKTIGHQTLERAVLSSPSLVSHYSLVFSSLNSDLHVAFEIWPTSNFQGGQLRMAITQIHKLVMDLLNDGHDFLVVKTQLQTLKPEGLSLIFLENL